MNDQTNAKAWTVVWQTPIGRMRGRVSAAGWLALDFPPAGQRKSPGRPDDKAQVRAITVPGATEGERMPSGAARRHLDAMSAFLSAIFAGRPPGVRPVIGRRGRTAFEERVWRAARRIPFGGTLTYGELAERAGHPGAARAVGQAMARNPLALLIPCHRVLARAAKGKSRLGGFSAGQDLKRRLLRLEGRAGGGGSWAMI
jgi:methylated-DNA-[protein]-cysteine S-methyltransferase